MKRFRFLASVCAVVLGSSAGLWAQSYNYPEGTVFSYSNEDCEENVKAEETYVVGELQKKDGKLLVRMDTLVDTTVAGISLGEMPGLRYICGDAGIEKVVLMTGDDIKKPIVSIISATSSQTGTDVSKEEIDSMFESEGEISFDLKAGAAAGNKFPDREIKAKLIFVKYNVSLSDGVYGGHEIVSTPAGEFDCVKVSYRMKATCLMNTLVNSYVTEWYSPELGLVKSECRDKKGRMQSVSLLESVQMPSE